jgi:hypothetical protein
MPKTRFISALIAARGDQPLVVIPPAKARALKEAFALGIARRGIRIRVDKDVQMVERTDEPDMARLQHAVAKHIARHIADPDHGEVAGLNVGAELAEMAFDELPGAA